MATAVLKYPFADGYSIVLKGCFFFAGGEGNGESLNYSEHFFQQKSFQASMNQKLL